MNEMKRIDSLDREDNAPTQGIWRVGDINHDNQRAYIYAEREYPHSVCVAQVRCETIMLDELKANARLIAAAPELLEALQEAFDRFTDNDMMPPNHALSVWIDKARDAIAKATVE